MSVAVWGNAAVSRVCTARADDDAGESVMLTVLVAMSVVVNTMERLDDEMQRSV